MKKTTLALLASALVANSASAITVFDSADYGTKLDFLGSARAMWKSTSVNESSSAGIKKEHKNLAVQDNGSRFGFKLTQQLGNGFYTLGRVEWRFRGKDNRGVDARSQNNFDHVYTRQLYAGFGHKQYGELVHGNLTPITDEVKQTDLANTLSLSDGLLVNATRRTTEYTYQGIEGLKVGAYYGTGSPRDNTGLSYKEDQKRKDVWGAAAIYKYKFDDLNSIKVATGVSRERFNQSRGFSAYDRTAYAFGVAYTINKTTLGMDLERRVTNDQSVSVSSKDNPYTDSFVIGNKRTENEARFIVEQALTDQWNAYTMYAYKTDKVNAVDNARDAKTTKHQFMLGTEYYIVPKYLKSFVEWQTSHERTVGLNAKTVRNNTTVIGVRAYW